MKRVRLKLKSLNASHSVTVVDDDGFEAELEGLKCVSISTENKSPAFLTAVVYAFEVEMTTLRQKP